MLWFSFILGQILCPFAGAHQIGSCPLLYLGILMNNYEV